MEELEKFNMILDSHNEGLKARLKCRKYITYGDVMDIYGLIPYCKDEFTRKYHMLYGDKSAWRSALCEFKANKKRQVDIYNKLIDIVNDVVLDDNADQETIDCYAEVRNDLINNMRNLKRGIESIDDALEMY